MAKSIMKEYEAAIQAALDAHSKVVNVTPEMYGQLGKTVQEAIMKDLAEAGITEFTAEQPIRIKTLATSKRKWNDALGRYFEWCVYEGMREKLLPEGAYEEHPEIAPVPSLGFAFQQYAIVSNAIHSDKAAFQAAGEIIKKTAKEAVEKVWKKYKGNITKLQAVAAGNKKGDLKIFLGDQEIYLELKYYRDPTKIRWYSTSDKLFFNNNLLSKFAKDTGDPKFWDQDDDSEAPLTKKDWTNNIRSFLFHEYIDSIKSGQFSDKTRDFFLYCVSKGEGVDSLRENKKRIIIGHNTTDTSNGARVTLTVSIDALVEALGEDESSWAAGKSSSNEDRYIFTKDKKEMGYLTTDYNDIYSHARGVRGDRSNYVPWDGDHEASKILFYLQKGFFGPDDDED